MGLIGFLLLPQAGGMGRPPLGEEYRYTLEEWRRTDPGLILYEEKPSLDPRLRELRAVAVGTNDTVWVGGDTHLVALTADGTPLARFALAEPPVALAVDDGGQVYVAMRDHIEVYEPDGRPIAAWARLGERAHITSVAVGDTSVFVADSGNRVVYVFDRSGALARIVGRRSSRENTGFVVPSPYFDVAIGTNGSVWVTNPGLRRVEAYGKEGTPGPRWGHSGLEPAAFCGCCNPTHLAIGPGGFFVTSEKGLPRVKRYEANGQFSGFVAGCEAFAPDVVGLDVAVDSRERVLVLDPSKRQVRVFLKKQQPIAP